MDIIITPSTLRGTLEAPPSKSHAHRLMTAVALAGKKKFRIALHLRRHARNLPLSQ